MRRSGLSPRRWLALATAAVVLPAGVATAAVSTPAVTTPAVITPAGSHVLAADLLPAALRAHRLGAVPAGQSWHVGISVRGSDAAGLARLERAQSTPASSDFRRFLTPQQFASRFGAAPADLAAVRRWLAANGLTISQINGAGTHLVAAGPARRVENAFRTNLSRYTVAGTSFAANDRPPTVPSAVVAVAGLDTLSTHLSTQALPVASFPLPASTDPASLWRAYEQPSSNRGRGEQLAAFGWGSPAGVAEDLRSFQDHNALPHLPLQIVQVGDRGTDTTGRIEWNLDSQAASGMAPDAAKMTFYFAASGSIDLLTAAIYRWADDPAGAKQASGSYGLCEVFSQLGVFDGHEAALTQATVEGRSFFASSGDAGSGCSAVVGVNGVLIGPIPAQEYPAASPHAIAVGGTVLYLAGTPSTRQQEIAWTHGGGGPSYVYATPKWQTVALATAKRAITDVSAQSGDLLSGYTIVSAGKTATVGGTSLSAPLWQGMWARINAAGPLGRDGVANLGFADPLIYRNNANAAAYARSFNDITLGANGLYPALPGYDFPTGWGTPRVTGLMLSLTGRTTPTAPR